MGLLVVEYCNIARQSFEVLFHSHRIERQIITLQSSQVKLEIMCDAHFCLFCEQLQFLPNKICIRIVRLDQLWKAWSSHHSLLDFGQKTSSVMDQLLLQIPTTAREDYYTEKETVRKSSSKSPRATLGSTTLA